MRVGVEGERGKGFGEAGGRGRLQVGGSGCAREDAGEVGLRRWVRGIGCG